MIINLLFIFLYILSSLILLKLDKYFEIKYQFITLAYTHYRDYIQYILHIPIAGYLAFAASAASVAFAFAGFAYNHNYLGIDFGYIVFGKIVFGFLKNLALFEKS